MKSNSIKRAGSRFMDAAVLTFSFLLFSLLTGFIRQPDFLLLLLLFVTVLYTGLRLGKHLAFRHTELPSHMAAVLSGNLLGLFAGNLVLAGLLTLLSLNHSAVVINLIASGAAFFILGTLSPIIRDSRSDLIAH
jgi:hypothetical protein